MNKNYFLVFALILGLIWSGCEKFLDEKPSKKLVVASTLQDLQALLDQQFNVNMQDPGYPEAAAGEFYVTDADLARRPETERRVYTWQRDNIYPATINDWYYTYNTLYRFNTVLEEIEKIPVNATNRTDWNNIKGQAHFMRAKVFLAAIQAWGNAYDPQRSQTDLGIPLRLGVDYNIPSKRATVAETYNQIIADLKQAISLSPNSPLHVYRGSKTAAYGLMARTYLAMGSFSLAGKYADSCLQLKNDLIDYNTLNAAANFPITQFNKEVIFNNCLNRPGILTSTNAKISPELYALYQTNDLRKTIYFRPNTDGSYAFKGSYDGTADLFTGISINEMYLIRAECFAREGKLNEALQDINALLKKRYNSTFINLSIANQNELIDRILVERRKELVFRCIRWMDIKRLNRLGAGISLTRVVNGVTYTLPANSERFTFIIPEDVIAVSGMPQNP